jgi:hypothetical protein
VGEIQKDRRINQTTRTKPAMAMTMSRESRCEIRFHIAGVT